VRRGAGLRVVAAAASVLILAGCGMVGDALGGEEDAGPHVAKIVVLVPSATNQAAAGQSVLDAVQLAVAEAAVAIPGWTVEVIAVEDPGDAEVGEVADQLTDDDDVAAVVGGLSSSVVRAVQPVLAGASIPFVSPADVEAEHTRGADPASPLRPYDSYFRTAVPGGDPIAAAAEYAVKGLNASAVAVVDGGSTDEAAQFTAEATKRGTDVLASGAAGADGAGIDQVIATAVEQQVRAVYVAGDAAVAAATAKKLAGTGLDARLLGGPAIRTEEFISAAGTAAEGAVAVLAPTIRPPTATVVDDLTSRLAAQGASAAGAFGAAAYDAGTALSQVLAQCLPPENSAAEAREGCVGEMSQLSFPGVTGEVAFDRYGERLGGRPEAFVVRDGVWVEVGAP
jgi:branched-chain amino acid transport system substrate-binding protein